MTQSLRIFLAMAAAAWMLTSHPAASAPTQEKAAGSLPTVAAVETFLADIAQNVAGSRLKVTALLPAGADPHDFEPTPADVAKVARCNVLIINGAGLEGFLDKLLQNAGGMRRVIDASAGLTGRPMGEAGDTDKDNAPDGGHHHEKDPHYWLDPNNVVRYVENIRRGLDEADPEGAKIYAANADAYIAQLKELDQWISDQVKQVPPDRRLLVTNHESFGYFADRYGFRIIGSIVPSVSTDASPSARQLTRLVDRIRATGAKAIFLGTGANPQLAKQMAHETGVRVVTGLYTHSITAPGGSAPSYIAMMKLNTTTIVDALK